MSEVRSARTANARKWLESRSFRNSGRPAIVLQQPAEPRPALDAVRRERQHGGLRRVGLGQRRVAERLMWPFLVVLRNEFTDQIVEVRGAASQYPIQALDSE